MVVLALLLGGCTIGAQVQGSLGRGAQQQETVLEDGSYLAADTAVEFRGVELLSALPMGFWDIAAGLGPRLTGGEPAPVTRDGWLEAAAADPELRQRLERTAAAYLAAQGGAE